MRKGQFVSNRSFYRIKNLKELKEVLSTRMGDLIVFDKGFIGDFEVLVSFKEKVAITSFLATHDVCNNVVSGQEWFDDFYN